MTPKPPVKRGQVATERAPLSAGNLKGQVATEFMLYTTVFMFIAVTAFVVINDIQSSEVPYQQNMLARETGEGFVNALTLAVKAGQGFSYNYTFPKTLFGTPYTVNFDNINRGNATILLEWNGSYGNFSYQYNVPSYQYRIGGTCVSASILTSNKCSNKIMLVNDGENLTITQLS